MMKTSNTDKRPIGVFDSGVGGLTAMKELIRLLSNEDIVYFGDTARVPYGSHSRETIIQYSRQDLQFLLSRNVKAVLVACGTVSANALDELRKMTDIPIVGVIEPASRAALNATRNKRIAVLATQATVRSHAYRIEMERLSAINGYSLDVMEEACPLFVPMIENGYVDAAHPIVKAVIEEYLKPVQAFGADTVILGCTHYPLIINAIRDSAPNLQLIESGKEAASALLGLIDQAGTNREPGERFFYVSENTETFRNICEMFVGEKIDSRIQTVRLSDTDNCPFQYLESMK